MVRCFLPHHHNSKLVALDVSRMRLLRLLTFSGPCGTCPCPGKERRVSCHVRQTTPTTCATDWLLADCRLSNVTGTQPPVFLWALSMPRKRRDWLKCHSLPTGDSTVHQDSCLQGPHRLRTIDRVFAPRFCCVSEGNRDSFGKSKDAS